MANRKPLVMIEGRTKELSSTDKVIGGLPLGGAAGDALIKNSSLELDASWGTPITASFQLTQQTFTGVGQNDTKTVSHLSDANYRRMVTVAKVVPGLTGVVDSTLDFDQADEGNYVQEDAVNGTDFVGSIVRLHSTPSATQDENPTSPISVDPAGDELALTPIADTCIGSVFGLQDNTRVNQWNTDEICYWNTSGQYAEIDLPETCRLWRSGTTDWINYIGTLEIRKWNTATSAWEVITGKHLTGLSQINQTQWDRFTDWLDPGKYRFYYISALRLDSEWYAEQQALDYTTTQPYYVGTTNLNQIPLASVPIINSCTVTRNEPIGTTIRGLVSFDGRASWSKWDGTAWVDAGVTDLGTYDFSTNGNTVADIETGLTGLTIGTQTALDFVFDLATTDTMVTPSVDLISINYDEKNTHRQVTGDFQIDFLSDTTTRIKQLVAGPLDLKVNLIVPS